MKFKNLSDLIQKTIKTKKHKKKVILIRHAQSEGNIKPIIHSQEDYNLTKNGIKQSECVIKVYAF